MAHRSDGSILDTLRDRLGKVPDRQIAELAGVSRTLVVNYRKRLGIAPYQGHKPVAGSDVPRTFRGRPSALDPFTDLLGKVPDAEVARRAGVTAENVRTYRQRRSIAATWQDGTEPGARAARPTDGGDGATAFLVHVDTPAGERSYAVVAHDIRDAATQAMARLPSLHKDGVIRGIQRVAGLLRT